MNGQMPAKKPLTTKLLVAVWAPVVMTRGGHVVLQGLRGRVLVSTLCALEMSEKTVSTRTKINIRNWQAQIHLVLIYGGSCDCSFTL